MKMVTFILISLSLSFLSLRTIAGGSSTVGPAAPVIYYACHKQGVSLENYQVSVGLNSERDQLQLMVADYILQTMTVEPAVKTVSDATSGRIQYSSETFSLTLVFLAAPIVEDGRSYIPAILREGEKFIGGLLCEALDIEEEIND